MKVLVAYTSRTGNTKKVADAVYEAIKADAKEIKTFSEISSTAGYDLLFVGFPIEAFGPSQYARDFLAQHVNGKNVALFITHAAPEDSEDLPPWIDACKDAASGARIVGIFNCQGELAEDIMTALKSSDDPKLKSFGEQGSTTKGQPDASRLERAREFARKMTS